jgi:hypothetical protein
MKYELNFYVQLFFFFAKSKCYFSDCSEFSFVYYSKRILHALFLERLCVFWVMETATQYPIIYPSCFLLHQC